MHSRHTLAHASLALALIAPTVAAQECVDDYIALRSGTEFLTGCSIGSSPCDFGTFDVYRVEGGGTALQTMIDALSFAVTGYTVIDVGPDTAPAVQEVYSPISIQASAFPDGLAIIARWGPTKAAIDGGMGVRCVTIDGFTDDGPIRIGAAANWMVLGDPILPNYSGWYGFEIRNGAAFGLEEGGGVRAAFLEDELDLAGNVIHDNQGRNFGGGVILQSVADGYVALNRIFANDLARDCIYAPGLPVRGAGIYQSGGHVQLLGNHVEQNGFGPDLCASPSVEPARQGGGVAVFMAFEEGTASHFSCGNKILENEASEGNGYWIDTTTVSGNPWVRLELNEIRGNASWQPTIGGATAIVGGFRGGGIAMRGRSDPLAKPPSTSTLDLEIVANRLTDNSVANPGLIATGAPDDVGGGIYSDVERNDSSDAVAIVGNAIWANTAPLQGGGAWIRHPASNAPVVSGDLHHNTIAWNEATTPGAVGAGIFLTADTRFDGSSLVIWGNEVAGVPFVSDGDWFGQPGVPDDFRFSQMPFFVSGTEILFGAGCSTVDPLLVAGDWHLTEDASPCVDMADPGFPVETDVTALALIVDPDGGPRLVDRIAGTAEDRDRGADEFLAFMRGDVNADGLFNLADSIYLLGNLFPGGQPPLPIQCDDAADANDDGLINIADAIAIQNYLFGVPGVWAPDLGICQISDPTPDPLDTEPGTPCIP